MLTARSTVLLLLHAAFAAWIVSALWQAHARRVDTVVALRSRAAIEASELDEQRRRLDIDRARLKGVDLRDPYVIELIAREQHQFQAPGEIRPPPLVPREAP